MLNKHFFKVLVIFSAMIILGLLAVYISSSLDKREVEPSNTTAVAK